MGEDLIRNLPSEIMLDILSRLDAWTAPRGKCVCKLWLDLLTTPEFVKSHLSKSIPGLVVKLGKWTTFKYKMVEFADEPDLNCYRIRLNTIFKLDLPFCNPNNLHSSINGLMLSIDLRKHGHLTLCNPITREYIKFHRPQPPPPEIPWKIFGFGVSRMSGQYKVVRISAGNPRHAPCISRSGELECQVYTIGSGSWRRLATCIWSTHLPYNLTMTFLCGNLHWWTRKDVLAPRQISHLNLETESISTFSDPPCDDRREKWYKRYLCISSDCLCVCDNMGMDIDLWVMKVYGDETSWTKEVTICKVDIIDIYCLDAHPIVKVLRNGDILMLWNVTKPFYYYYYSISTKTIEKVEWFDLKDYVLYRITHYTPSFLSLKTFATENVTSF
ncbi:F-box protein CPR1-like [Salvia hispanica]|uniref:F-box protein CPR1-like n=1 Tax=Salvia hispanica TaxID=49212 RepID=UPI00200986A8|nr:F-box protein CPR1-like [Salvia hispanica]